MLTQEQEQEAKRLYIESQLTPEARAHTERLRSAKAAAEAAEAVYATLQGECTHPLIARVTENRSSTGNWDRDSDSYWTAHHCTLCDLRWTTDQRWHYVGTRQGHPDDKAAAER